MAKDNNNKKDIEDYVFYDVGSSNFASDYEETTNYIIKHIKKTKYDDGAEIAQALRTLECCKVNGLQGYTCFKQTKEDSNT